MKDIKRTSMSDSSREKNLLVRLELKNGKTCVVDLGRGTTLSDLDIDNGSKVRLQGQRKMVNGKALIIARKISVDGDSTRIRGGSRQNVDRDRDQSDEHSSTSDRYQGYSSYTDSRYDND